MNPIRCLPVEKIAKRPLIILGTGNKLLLLDILKLIFRDLNLKSQDLASCNLVCRQWYDLTDHKPENDQLWNETIAREILQLASFIFGKEEWFKYYGDIGNAPNYPRDICKILASNCPFFKGQTVGKTHMFVLIPETVNGNPVTLDSLRELVKNPKDSTKINHIQCHWKTLEEHAKIAVKKTHWILITNDVINGSIIESYPSQEKMVTKHAHYNLPSILEVILTVFTKYVYSGMFMLGQDIRTFSHCQGEVEGGRVIVGDFCPDQLTVSDSCYHYYDGLIGVMGCRYFDSAEALGFKSASPPSDFCILS